MPFFPRGAGALSRLASPPRFPAGLQSWGQSGKGQFRSVMNMGREWDEIYPLLSTSNPNVRALLQAINQALREGIVWDIQHPYWHQRFGLGGGATIQVNGASQSGNILNLKGASLSITNWARQGDIIKVAGSPVVFDVAADTNSDGAGNIALPISPPIFVGQSPANNAAVIDNATLIFFKAVIVGVSAFPSMDTTKYIDPGLTVTWREQPL